MTLLLIRHGETDWNREPARCQGWAEVPLNDTGRQQARELGAALRERAAGGDVPPIELIVSSHLLRARETAEIVREEFRGGVPLTFDPRLAETNRGRWETRAFAEIMTSEPDVWRAYREHPESFRFPGGESLAEQQQRVLAALLDAARRATTALLVTHGGSIRLARCFLEGAGIEGFHEMATANGGVFAIGDVEVGRIAAHVDGGPRA
jgi:broad specificity phosphatase PhoE